MFIPETNCKMQNEQVWDDRLFVQCKVEMVCLLEDAFRCVTGIMIYHLRVIVLQNVDLSRKKSGFAYVGLMEDFIPCYYFYWL